MTRLILPAALLALASACSQKPGSIPDGEPSPVPEATVPPATDPQTNETPAGATPGRQHVYTSLEGCRVIRREDDEMPFVETECEGVQGHALRISDSDARQRMTLVPPGGAPYAVPVARIGGGAFSSFGKSAEWRGASAQPFTPDSLIVRYEVAEEPYPAPKTSYLLVVNLRAEPCLVAVVPPGPAQNDSARAAADLPGACRTE